MSMKLGQAIYALERSVSPSPKGDYCSVYVVAYRVINWDDKTIVVSGKDGVSFKSYSDENLYLNEEAVLAVLEKVKNERAASGRKQVIVGLAYYETPA